MPILESLGTSKEVSSPDGVLTIIDDISFQVEAGQSVAIAGPSGSGKSTLLALLAGLDVPTRGEVRLNGAPFSTLDEDARARTRAGQVGFVFQSFHLVPSMTALENVRLPLELVNAEHPDERAAAALAEVGLAHRARYPARSLSGGEQQRCALARAFVARPRLLFADEPTGNLDAMNGQRIADLLFDLNHHHGTTLILVTHESQLASRCDRTLHLCGGKLVAAKSESSSP